jgi:hypothetical protein
MKLTPGAMDAEILAVERAIVADRRLLEQATVDYVEGLRETAVSTMASPKFLLGALGVGFIVGKFLFRPQPKKDAAPVKKSFLGLLGAGALSLAQAQFGGPVGLARWLIARTRSAKASRRDAVASPQALSTDELW